MTLHRASRFALTLSLLGLPAVAGAQAFGLNEINDHQGAIAAAVEEQTATTAEMQRNVADAAAASTRIAGTITDVADAARTTEAEASASQAAISTVATMARELRETIGRFQH